MKSITFLIAIVLAIFLLSFSVFVYAKNTGTALCWNRTGEIVYRGDVQDLVYAIDSPGIIWLKDGDGNDVFIQNLECLISMHKDKKHVRATRQNKK